MQMRRTSRRQPKWFMPTFCVFLGCLMLAAFWIGGKPGVGLAALGVMAGLGLVFAVGGRSETVRGLRGDGRDERWALIDMHATALTGLVLIVALIAAFLWEVAHGRDGAPYTQLCAIGGVAYAGFVALLRARS